MQTPVTKKLTSALTKVVPTRAKNIGIKYLIYGYNKNI
jgi:hypothetical protein